MLSGSLLSILPQIDYPQYLCAQLRSALWNGVCFAPELESNPTAIAAEISNYWNTETLHLSLYGMLVCNEEPVAGTHHRLSASRSHVLAC